MLGRTDLDWMLYYAALGPGGSLVVYKAPPGVESKGQGPIWTWAPLFEPIPGFK